MKKTKIGLIIATLTTIIVTLILTMTGSFGGGDSEWDDPWTWPSNEYTGGSGTYYGFQVSHVTAAGYNNIYCIENGGTLDEGNVLKMSGYKGATNFYIVSAVVSIPGDAEDNAWVCTYDQSEDGRFWYGDMRNKHAEIKITVKN